MGPGGCGKSALAVRLLSRRFISDYCPVLEDTYYRVLNNGELQVVLGSFILLLLVLHHQLQSFRGLLSRLRSGEATLGSEKEELLQR